MQAGRVRAIVLPLLSLALAAATIAGSVSWTDDAFPFAPFRMFSYANSPNGVVRKMALEGQTASGTELHLDASEFGLRRAELEEQTPWNAQVPKERMEALAESYDSTHDDELVSLSVVVTTIRLVDGTPAPGTSKDVIGTWVR